MSSKYVIADVLLVKESVNEVLVCNQSHKSVIGCKHSLPALSGTDMKQNPMHLQQFIFLGVQHLGMHSVHMLSTQKHISNLSLHLLTFYLCDAVTLCFIMY